MKKIQLEHHASNLKSYIDNNTITKGVNIKHRVSSQIYEMLGRYFIQLFLSDFINFYSPLLTTASNNSEINVTLIKTPLSVTPDDMEVIKKKMLSDIQRIVKQNSKAKQNKKFKRNRLNQQSFVFKEEKMLSMLKESKPKAPRKGP